MIFFFKFARFIQTALVKLLLIRGKNILFQGRPLGLTTIVSLNNEISIGKTNGKEFNLKAKANAFKKEMKTVTRPLKTILFKS